METKQTVNPVSILGLQLQKLMVTPAGCKVFNQNWAGVLAASIIAKESIYKSHSYHISLSTIVLNSRDWSEIVWLPKISHLKINLAIGFI